MTKQTSGFLAIILTLAISLLIYNFKALEYAFSGPTVNPLFRIPYLYVLLLLAILCLHFGMIYLGVKRDDIRRALLLIGLVWCGVLSTQLITGESGSRYNNHKIIREDKIIQFQFPAFVLIITFLLLRDDKSLKKGNKIKPRSRTTR